jgi:hypothetical protein
MNSTRYRLLGLLTACVLGSSQTLAADPSLCAAIADPAARLICYDAALKPAPAAPAAPKAAAAPAVAATAAEPAKRSALSSMFGLLPKRQKQDRPQLQASVVDIQVRRDGQIVTLDNDQVWMITEPQPNPFAEPDEAIVIDPASLGSFLMSRASGGGSVRVKRLR